MYLNPNSGDAALTSQGSRCRPHLDSFTVGCWNVTTLEAPLAAEHLETTLNNYRYDIIALSETHNIGKESRLQGRMFLSGGDRRYAGVGFLLSHRARRSVIFTESISDRLMAVRLKLKIGTLLVIAVYAPTSVAADDVIRAFYHQLDRWIHDNLKTNEKLIVAGDFNAKLGTERINVSVLGPYGYGERNERGDRLIDFCTSNNLTAAHTWFRKRPSRKVTWTSRANNARNAIDHILVSQTMKNWITDCRSFSAVFDTDHRLVLCNIKLKIDCATKPTKQQPKPDLNSLRDPTTTQTLCDAVRDKLHEFNKLDEISTLIHTNAVEACNVAPFRINQPYLTPTTIQLIQDKREARNTADFPRLRNAVKRACKGDMEKWLLQQVETINHAFSTNDTRTLFKTTNLLTVKPIAPLANIKDKNGCVLLTVDDEVQRWEEYARELFHLTTKDQQSSVIHALPPTNIRRDQHCVKSLKNNKAPGSDLVLSEFIKSVAEDAHIRLALDKAVQDMWLTGTWPYSLTNSSYIVLHKKNDRGNCSNYRTLALISHMSKIILNIISND
ncbi:endonuclease-reverse transcriptase [Apostichopus japonicus]|uniref:Endonuclease-reverse transcriptase n=1 Tax=Stichopus japonicus TaxID=307972 RepID=A0A2G8JRW1_STIJA|nr:endonuclease-reverse transcriptase [Apostichopus japonicus]PIK62316.1 endonuclease-reverse transcriptase [Apostichopus japonicus]